MPYAIGIMRELVKEYGIKVDCIYWDEKKRTPFLPVDESGITFYKRSLFDYKSIIRFIEERSPSIIYVVGRMDKLYLETVLHFRGKAKVVTGSDNQWNGGIKQRISVFLSERLYRRYFEYFWVPGKRQHLFARKMGYPENKIVPNLLSGDTSVFSGVYAENKKAKEDAFPHNIVFTGRFAKEKGLDLLIEAFNHVRTELSSDWRLILVGSGNLAVGDHPFIEVKGFMTMQELAMNSKNWGVFCLPSTYEPWGVVIHEFTMAGLPVICSDKVGAADGLVINKENGYIFKSGDVAELKNAIRQIMGKSDSELMVMGEKGHELSKKISPLIAAKSLLSILK
jgi:glycosyltransferase involved in cell wall biosynthesis